MDTSIGALKAWAGTHIRWFGQSAFRVATDTGKVILIDPFRVPSSAGPADLILITHPHRDHYDRRAILRLSKADTVLVLPRSCAEAGQRGMTAGQIERIGSIGLKGVPAYNVSRRFHPKSGNWLGYLVSVDGVTVYHAGDTDPIPEMAGLHPDIALLPVGGMFTMNWRKATEAVHSLKASLAIPMHYSALIGGRRAGRRFSRLVGPASLILPKG